MDTLALGKVDRLIRPRRERQRKLGFRFQREADTKRIGLSVPHGPSFPKTCRPSASGGGFRFIVYPQKLQKSMFKEETTVGRALARMNVPAALNEARIKQCLRLWGTNGCTDEDVIEAKCHLRHLRLETTGTYQAPPSGKLLMCVCVSRPVRQHLCSRARAIPAASSGASSSHAFR